MKKTIFSLIVIHSILSFSPIFKSVIFVMIDLAIVCALLLLCKGSTSEYSRYLQPYLIFFAYSVVLYSIGISDGSLGTVCVPVLTFYATPILTFYCIDNFTLKELKTLAIFVLLAFAFNLIWNSVYCTLFPDASLEAVVNYDLSSVNVAGTVLSTNSLFFAEIMCCIIALTDKKNTRLWAFVFLLISIYYIVYCGMRASVLFLLLLAVLTTFLSDRIQNYALLIFCCAVLYMIFSSFQEDIFMFIADVVPSDRLKERIYSLVYLSANTVDEDSFSGRMKFYMMSFDTFTSNIGNFIVGVGNHSFIETENRHLVGVGGHSQILDLLAEYGIVGFVCVFLMIKCFIKKTLSIFSSLIASRLFKTALLIFIITAFVKHVQFNSTSMLIFFLLPVVIDIVEKDKAQVPNGE